jgi:hypothetical protein
MRLRFLWLERVCMSNIWVLFDPTLGAVCSVLRLVGLAMYYISSSEDSSRSPSSTRPIRPIKLDRCIRMFLLHIIVVVSGVTTVGMWRIMFKMRCVPHSVVPDCCIDYDWSVRHGPVIMVISHVWSVGTQVRFPQVPAELCSAIVFVTLLISARNRWLLAFSGRSVMSCVLMVFAMCL